MYILELITPNIYFTKVGVKYVFYNVSLSQDLQHASSQGKGKFWEMQISKVL